MVSNINPIDELMRRAKTRQRQVKRMDEFVKHGYISKRLGEYAQHLLILDHLADESRTYASLKDFEKTCGSLTEMRFKLDGIGAILLADGEIEAKEENGIRYLANPNLDNIEKYKELYDFAQQKYDEAVNQCAQILEVA